MSKGRKAIPPDLRDNNIYKDKGRTERHKASSIVCDSAKLICPSHLPEGAKKEWRRVVKLYRDLQLTVLNDLDKQVLVSYVIAVDIRDKLYAEWRQTEAIMVNDNSKTTRQELTPAGTPIKASVGNASKKIVNPLLREIDKYNATIRVLAEQLALTPAGRAAYAVRQEKANRSPAEEFMGDE